MNVLPIDVSAVLGIMVGGLFVLIPIAGITARFALKPIVEAVARMREVQGGNREVALIEQRVSLIEQQLQAIETNVERLVAKKEFDHQLTGPSDT